MPIPHESYPHIVEQIFDHVLADDPITLRGVSRAHKAAADAVLCAHIMIQFATHEFRLADVPSYEAESTLPLDLAPAWDDMDRTLRRTVITGLFRPGPRPFRCRVPGLSPDGSPAERAECARLLRLTKRVDILLPPNTSPPRHLRSLAPFLDRDLLYAVSTGLETVRGESYHTPFAPPTLVLHGELSIKGDSAYPGSAYRVAQWFPLPARLVLNVPRRDNYTSRNVGHKRDAVRLPLQSTVPGCRLTAVVVHLYKEPQVAGARRGFADLVMDLVDVIAGTLALDWTVVMDDNMRLWGHEPGRPRSADERLRWEIRWQALDEDGPAGGLYSEDEVDEALARLRITSRSEYLHDVGEEQYRLERGLHGVGREQRTVGMKRKGEGLEGQRPSQSIRRA
ncbi:hypothetical protein Q8F55_009299 [Vanrija albida]|uniref:F-box domain-containing protein n=1 Tax=Vanrija albida TaxID=181172 RepID=A0ABR3PT78_9TREE